MLEFLITSKVRRRLLLLLWSGATGSASELAKRAGVGFAGAYRELQAMRRLELVIWERRGAATVFSANRRHPVADALASLIVAPAKERVEDREAEKVRSRVAALGAPVLSRRRAKNELPLEDTLVAAVALSHKDPALARSLPVAFYRQAPRIDGHRLVNAARERGEKAAVGLLLELTTALSGDRRFTEWARPLRDRRIRARRPFFHTRAADLQARTLPDESPRIARRWGYRLDVPLDDFSTLFARARRVR